MSCADEWPQSLCTIAASKAYLVVVMQAGCQNKPTVFLFDETQIVQETFLEDINNILTSGESPSLYWLLQTCLPEQSALDNATSIPV